MFIRTESFKEFLRYYPVVSTIVAIHITLYLISLLPIFPHYWLFETLAGVNLFILQGEWWRLITPIFIHAGFAHMLFNSFSLVIFGPPIEQMLGKFRFVSLYLASGIIANVATLLLKPLTYTHVGSSGAIFGLFGILVAIILFRRDMMSRNNTQLVLTIVVIGVIMTFIQPNINVTAHLFGLFSGFLLGVVTLGKRKEFNQAVKTFSSRATRGSIYNQASPQKKLIWIGVIILVIIWVLSR